MMLAHPQAALFGQRWGLSAQELCKQPLCVTDQQLLPCLQTILTHVAALAEANAKKDAEMDAMRRQLDEQTTFVSANKQSIRALQSQVSALRVEFVDKTRPAWPGGSSTSAQGGLAVGGSRFVDVAERRNSGPKLWQPGDEPQPIRDGSLSGQLAGEAASKGAATQSDTPPPPTAKSSRSSSPGSIPGPPAAFTRSPPGLSLHPQQGEEGSAGVVSLELSLCESLGGDTPSTNVPDQASSSEAEGATMRRIADAEGMTVLHYAAMHGHTDVCRALLEGNGGGSEELQQALQVPDWNGNTALHIAALHDHGKVCALILEADVTLAEIPNHFGDTPLDIARRRRGEASVSAAFRQYHEL